MLIILKYFIRGLHVHYFLLSNQIQEQKTSNVDNSNVESSNQLLTQPSTGFGSICWLNTVPSGGSRNSGMDQIDTIPSTSPANGVNGNGATNGRVNAATNGINNSRIINNGNFMPQRGGRIHPLNERAQPSSNGGATSPSTTGETSAPSPTKDPNNCFVKAIQKVRMNSSEICQYLQIF